MLKNKKNEKRQHMRDFLFAYGGCATLLLVIAGAVLTIGKPSNPLDVSILIAGTIVSIVSFYTSMSDKMWNKNGKLKPFLSHN